VLKYGRAADGHLRGDLSYRFRSAPQLLEHLAPGGVRKGKKRFLASHD
jgi:hypothetical protein